MPYISLLCLLFLHWLNSRLSFFNNLSKHAIRNLIFVHIRHVIKYLHQKKEPAVFRKHQLLSIWFVLLLCYLPYLLFTWPIDWSIAVSYQTEFLVNSNIGISGWHPLIHTLWLSIPLNISQYLTDSYGTGTAFCNLSQYFVIMIVYSYLIWLIKQWGIPKFVWIAVLLFVCLYPGIAANSITVFKDILFSAFFSLSITLLMDILFYPQCSKKDGLHFGCAV